MEHSYIGNKYVERIMSMLIDNPSPLLWVCDYNEEPGNTWEDIEESSGEYFLEHSSFPAFKDDNYIILNHTKEMFINTELLKDIMKNEHSIDYLYIHPLPILCNSNEYSQGGGDFHQEDSRRATWKGDTIEIIGKDDSTSDYKDVTKDVIFIEE